MSKFGNILRSLRIREGLTQEELGKYVGTTRSAIGMYEQGKREPNQELLEKFADFFNVDMNYLMGAVIENKDEYYLNLKTRQIAQEIFENEELRALFDATRNASPEDLGIVKDLLLNLKRKNRDID